MQLIAHNDVYEISLCGPYIIGARQDGKDPSDEDMAELDRLVELLREGEMGHA